MSKSKTLATNQLLSRLLNTRHFDHFIGRYEELMNVQTLPEYLKELCETSDVLPAHVIKNAGIERMYGHQLFNGKRKPTREKALLLAFGFGLDYNETKVLLEKARKPALYPKIKRDAFIIFALERHLSLNEVQDTLYDMGLPILGEGIE